MRHKGLSITLAKGRVLSHAQTSAVLLNLPLGKKTLLNRYLYALIRFLLVRTYPVKQ